MSVWFAYYGEASATGVPEDLRVDGRLRQQARAGARGAYSTGGYQIDAGQLATGYLAMIDGLVIRSLKIAHKKERQTHRRHLPG